MKTVEERLEALELRFRRAQQGNRVLTFALITLACAAGAQLAPPKNQTPAKVSPAEHKAPEGKGRLRTIEAEEFILRDRLGQLRLSMAVTEVGPAISMFDENGHKRLELTQTPTASGFQLLDSNEVPIASLEVQHDGDRARLEMTGPQGKSLISAEGLTVRDLSGDQRLQLALINGNFPVLGISQRGQSGPPSVEITAGDTGTRGVKIHDDDGHPLFSVSAAEDGTTHLNLGHPKHERSLQVTAGPSNQDGPQIALFAPAKRDGAGGLLARLQLGLRANHQPYIRIVDEEGEPVFTAPAK